MKHRTLTWLCCYLVAIGGLLTSLDQQAPTAQAQEPAVAESEQRIAKLPPPRTTYKGREIAETTGGPDWLMRSERDQEEGSEKLLEALHIKQGQTVCDLGCGNGYYTLRLARLVGDTGTVLAVDIQREMLRLLHEQARQERLSKRIKPILGTLADPRLPEKEVDLILLVDVYHEFSYPEEMLHAIRKALKPRGRLVLVEYRQEDPNVPIRPLHKMSKEQILKEIPPNGFKLVEQFDGLPWQHVLFFEPTADDPAKERSPGSGS